LSDRYQIERELGKGGMATVFLATDIKHEREVAIKVLHPELSATLGADRFEREIKVAAKLQHPHILGMYDSGVADGLLYYVMPFVKGEALRDRLDRETQLPVEDAIRITLEVADALGYAHEHGVIHRDIKPENILLSGGHALVADFGIARAVTEAGGSKLTQTGMAVGTPVYMSPEQAAGEHVGPSSDIYSLGCVLYEMLAGEPPFTGKNPQAIMARHAMEMVPSIRIVRSAVPEEVEEAILAAMGKMPADRPQTAAQFVEILGLPMGSTAARRVMGRTGTRRVPTGAVAARAFEQERPLWRRPWVLALAGVFLVGGGFAAWRLSANQRPARLAGGLDSHKIAVLYFEDQSPDKKLAYLADGLTDELIAQLGVVQGLRVVSKLGVAPFRDPDLPRDSIAKVLAVGTIVEGSVEPTKAGVRVAVRLVDGNTGVDIRGARASFDFSGGAVLALRDSVASKVAQFLRERLGSEISLQQSQAGTQNQEAWSLFQKAERLFDDAEARARGDTTGIGGLLRESDSLLVASTQLDSRWSAPILTRGLIARRRVVLAAGRNDPVQASAWADSGLALADRALALDATDAGGLELRGSIQYMRWRRRLEPDPAKSGKLLQLAEDDLKSATGIDAGRASAWYWLGSVYASKPDLVEATLATRRAYEADAFLAEADVILWRLYSTAYDNEQFLDASKWCDEGRRRFPSNSLFVQCQLWLLTTNARPADPAAAWSLLPELKRVTPEAEWPYQERQAQMLVASALARAASAPGGAASLKDSADRVLIRARTSDPAIDPERELLSTESFIRSLMGDRDEALRLLKAYLIAHPEHRALFAQSQHWWWRDLKTDPRFKALVQ
jgi:TolB-like protein/tetratricopeptide (TPR) repeat protein